MILKGNALHVPLEDESVKCAATSETNKYCGRGWEFNLVSAPSSVG